MKKILLSVITLATVGIVGTGATSAIFSDEEASTGNTFTAGAVDLTVDNESYYNGVLNQGTTWLQAADLNDGSGPGENGAYLFFDFDDVKPGDWGEDSISLHVNNNDSWLCADVTLTSDDDNGLTEPEGDDGDTTDGAGAGELADAINFMWWADDGDVVLEDDEILLPAGTLGALAVNETATVALADSNGNIWDGSGPFPAESIRYVGKAWCLGDMSADPVAQDGLGKTATSSNGPLVRGSGIECDGQFVDNVTQTDSMTADITFYAEQSRHNGDFVCGAVPESVLASSTITVVKILNTATSSNTTVADFDFFIDGTEVQLNTPFEVAAAGTYTVTETGPVGEQYETFFSGDCDVNGNVTITSPTEENLTCTITNTLIPPGQLEIDKLVTFTGPALDIGTLDFEFTVTNDVTNQEFTFFDELPQELPPGTYSISEEYVGTENISFEATYIGDCSEIGTTNTASVTIASNDDLTCQAINSITDEN